MDTLILYKLVSLYISTTVVEGARKFVGFVSDRSFGFDQLERTDMLVITYTRIK